MRDVLAEVVDDRYVFEMIPDFARNVISGFARLGGETVGIIANNPLVLAGVLDMDAAIKASRWGLVAAWDGVWQVECAHRFLV
jgi:propionyl-CoA carboxylase beta chain